MQLEHHVHILLVQHVIAGRRRARHGLANPQLHCLSIVKLCLNMRCGLFVESVLLQIALCVCQRLL